MKITISRLMNFLMISLLALLLSACSGSGSDSSSSDGSTSSESGALTLNITDAPVDELHQVWVTFTQVIIHPSDGGADIVEDVDDGKGVAGMTLNLLKLGEGSSVRLLNTVPLPAGNYSWIRLVIDAANTYVIVDEGGEQLTLDCSSCEQSGLKLNKTFKIVDGGLVDFTIDFDLRSSITLTRPNSLPYEDDQFKLRPTLRIIETNVASAQIVGTVDAALVDPTAPNDCVVYVYEGDDTAVEPDDICVIKNATTCPGWDASTPNPNPNRPLTTADVDEADFSYRTGYLYPGTYTVALLCDQEDLPEEDDDVTFIGEATVEAVAGDNEHDF